MSFQNSKRLGPAEILEFQPNRYPFLMLDVVEDVYPGRYAKGFKNLTWNEWYFPQHFPGNPNLPGALQLEALAQMLTIAITTLPGLAGKVTHALSHTVKFKREVIPGDRFDIEVNVISWSRGIAKGFGTGKVNGEIACEASMKIAIPEILDEFLPKRK
jgi:3-hydroxyacyl-[acyl-carrier-protein] dehydratase